MHARQKIRSLQKIGIYVLVISVLLGSFGVDLLLWVGNMSESWAAAMAVIGALAQGAGVPFGAVLVAGSWVALVALPNTEPE